MSSRTNATHHEHAAHLGQQPDVCSQPKLQRGAQREQQQHARHRALPALDGRRLRRGGGQDLKLHARLGRRAAVAAAAHRLVQNCLWVLNQANHVLVACGDEAGRALPERGRHGMVSDAVER